MTYNFYSPLVESVKTAVEAIETRYADLSRKYSLLRKQYGIASKKIHSLKAENALLREQLKDLNDSPSKAIKTPREFYHGDPEPADKDLVLQSARPLSYGKNKPFILKWEPGFGNYDDAWWSFENDRQNTYACWDYWLEAYGPFKEILDV